MLDAARITSLLTTTRLGRSLDLRDETGSTNDDARVAATEGATAGHVVCADAQTAGRGSHGRAWSSPAGTDLYLSIVERVELPPRSIPVLTLAVGLGVSRAVEALAGGEVRVKWPNDVWLGGKKCAGILVESSSTGAKIDAFVIGIGLGVNRSEWPPELREIATSMHAATGRTFDREVVLARLLLEVETAIDTLARLGPRPIVDALTSRLALGGRPVRIGGTTGTLLGLGEGGALRIRTDAGLVKEIVSGTLRPRPSVHLRRWRRDELDAYAAIVCDAETMAPVGGPIRRDEVTGLFERHFEDSPDPKWLVVRAIEVGGVPVGSGRLSEVVGPDGATRLELGYLVRKDHAGRGIASELALAMIEEARKRGAERLHAKVAPSNVASQRVLENAGFTRHGEPDADGTLQYAVTL